MGLEPLPETFVATREALHQVAEEVIAPARKPHNEIALTATPGGFGTPPFEFEGRVLQVRVEGADIVVDEEGAERRAPVTSLAAAAELVGGALYPDGAPEDQTQLSVDPVAAQRLGALYGFAAELLDRFRADLPADAAPSSTNLWPEHFDLAFEAGAEAAGQRANYGVSPGDEQHSEPYVYVGPWSGEPEGELWNATGFSGAELTYAELVGAADPAALALEFVELRFRALTE